MMNVLLVGEESAGCQVLRKLAASDHRVVAVMTSPPSDQPLGGVLWQLAGKLGYDRWPARRIRDVALADDLCSVGVDLLLNVHSLFIIPSEVLKAPRIGSFNIHPGPLPRYAGLNAVSWSIYHGETTHGVTLHWMAPGIDEGAIAYQSSVDVLPTDTGLSLSLKCVRGGLLLIDSLLRDASAGPDAIPRKPQDLSRRTYFGKSAPQDGVVTWREPARLIADFVRACDYAPFVSPWGIPSALLGNRKVGLVRVARTGERCLADPGAVARTVDGEVRIATADEWLIVQRVSLDGEVLNASSVPLGAELMT